MEMDDGYIKLWRQSMSSQVFQNEGLWKVWTWCLMKANHKPSWVKIKTGKSFTEIQIQSGQFIFGRSSAAKELRMNPETVRKRIEKLKNIENLTIESTSQYSIINITNWDTYQCDNKEFYQQKYQPSTSRVPAEYQPSTTNKNEKNDKNDKNIKENTKEKLEDFLKTRTASLSLSLYEEKILEFFYYRKKIKAPYKTEKGINGLLSDIQGCVSAGLDVNQCLELAMAREWKAVNPKYFENKNGGKNNAAIKPTFTGNDTRQSEWECPTPSWAKDLE